MSLSVFSVSLSVYLSFSPLSRLFVAVSVCLSPCLSVFLSVPTSACLLSSSCPLVCHTLSVCLYLPFLLTLLSFSLSLYIYICPCLSPCLLCVSLSVSLSCLCMCFYLSVGSSASVSLPSLVRIFPNCSNKALASSYLSADRIATPYLISALYHRDSAAG